MKRISFAVLPVVFLVAGCGGSGGPEVATVRGKITFDGKPLPNAGVRFIPENGRPAFGRTDENGEYELQYTEDTEGAIPGKNVVRITTAQPAMETEEGESTPAQPETIPEEYNTQSTLTFDVKPGQDNVADFDLQSGGVVVAIETFDDAGD